MKIGGSRPGSCPGGDAAQNNKGCVVLSRGLPGEFLKCLPRELCLHWSFE